MCDRFQKHLSTLSTWGTLALILPFVWNCSSTQKYAKKSYTTKGFRPYPVKKKRPKNKRYRSRRIALLIGINKYEDKAWHPLRYAHKDAKDLANVLKQRKLGKFDRILLYTTPKKTTKSYLQKAFSKLNTWNIDPRDTVFVYISAHGTLSRNSQHVLQRYLVTSDTKNSKISKTAISVPWLRQKFDRLKSQRKVMLLATCHSGSGKSRFNREIITELKTLKSSFFVKPMEKVSRASIFLGVCGFGETAQESHRLKNDIYTHYFIKALQNKYDANGDGAVTVSEAHDYAKELTYIHTKGRQRPYAESDILGTDPIVLIGKKKRQGKPVIYAYNQGFYGVHVKVNGTTKGAFPKGITVNSGKQRITLVSHDKKRVLFDGPVYFNSGERVDARALFERKSYNYAIALKSGYQMFINGSSADKLSRSLPLFGAEFKLSRPYELPIDLRFEFIFSRNSHILTEQENRPQTVTELNLGISAVYLLNFGQLSMFFGPRLSAIYLDRQSPIHKEVNDFFYSFQPGLLLGFEYRFLPRWSFFTEGRLNYTYVKLEEGLARHQGSYEFLGGIFFHF